MSANPSRRKALASGAGALLAAALPSNLVWAAGAPPGWPSRTLKLVVGFPGGSSPDLVARTLAEPLSQALGQTVVVENRVGAGGNIAASAVAQEIEDHQGEGGRYEAISDWTSKLPGAVARVAAEAMVAGTTGASSSARKM